MTDLHERTALDELEREFGAVGATGWAAEVRDPGSDDLLSWRDRRSWNLDLADAADAPRKRLLEGEPVRVAELYPDEPRRTAARHAARALLARVRDVDEQAGVAIGVLALGRASWYVPTGVLPAAPVLLRRVDAAAGGPGSRDVVLRVRPDARVNPRLLTGLADAFGLRIELDDLRDPYGGLAYVSTVERLRAAAPTHLADGFRVEHRAVVGACSTVALGLRRDLADVDLLAGSPIVAALGGDAAAAAGLRAGPRRGGPPTQLVLDADPAQQVAVDDALSGSLVLAAPPGTGATQTVAALVAAAAGRGERVLVVSSGRAPLDDLVDRLGSVGLGGIVRDLRDDPRPAGGRAPVPEPGAAPDLRAARAPLVAHVDALHVRREPWGLSAYEVELLGASVPQRSRTAVRLDRAAVRRLDPTTRERQRAAVAELLDLESRTAAAGAWAGAAVPDEATAETAVAAVTRLSIALPAARDGVSRAALEVGLPAPSDVAGLRRTVTLLDDVDRTNATFDAEVWAAPLGDLVVATARGRDRREQPASLGWSTRRALRREAAALLRDPGRTGADGLHDALAAAAEQLRTWRATCRDSRIPRSGPALVGARAAVQELDAALGVLGRVLPDLAPDEQPLPELGARVARLAAEADAVRRAPRIRRLRADLEAAGLAPLVEAIRSAGAGVERAGEAYDDAVARGLREELRAEDPRLAVPAAELDAAVAAFVTADRAAAEAAAQEVRRAGASAAEPPVVVASAFRVPELLPPERSFDLVVVEDAGRLGVAEAVPALARGQRVVAVGDDLLPPYAGVRLPADGAAPSADPAEALAAGPPSLLEALRAVGIPERALLVEHRARDERIREVVHGRASDRVVVPGALPGAGVSVRRPTDLRAAVVDARGSRAVVLTLAPAYAAVVEAELADPRAEVRDVARALGRSWDTVVLALRPEDLAERCPDDDARLVEAVTGCARDRLVVVAPEVGADEPGLLAGYVRQAAERASAPRLPSAVDPDRLDALEQDLVRRLAAAGLPVRVPAWPDDLEAAPAIVLTAPDDPARAVLAVETDGPAYRDGGRCRDRDRLRPEQLRRLGWTHLRVWTLQLGTDPDAVVARVRAAWQGVRTSAP